MRKRIIALLLTGALTLSLLPATIWAAPAKEEGAQPIATAAEFAAMDPDGCYRLTEDITVTTPFAAVFTGSLDGGGHTVTLALTAEEDTAALALFPEVDGASFTELLLDGSVSAGAESGISYAAALVGTADGDVTVTACKNQSALDIAASDAAVGGLVALQRSGSLTVIGCVGGGDIHAPAAVYAGGLVGRQEPYAVLTMRACYQAADVAGGGEEGMCAGGLIGGVGGDAAVQSCWSAASPRDRSAALTAWGAQRRVSADIAGALCGAVEDGGSLTGSRCFWIAAPVGSDDAFFLPDSGLFTEYGTDRRAVLLASLNAGTDDLSDGCTFLLPPEQGWPLLRWEQPLSDEERLAAARQTAAGEVEDAFAAAIARVQARLTAVTGRTGLWYELYGAARQTAEEAAAQLERQRSEALAALEAAGDIDEIQRHAAESRTAMEQTAAGVENTIGGNGVSADKRWDGAARRRPSGAGTDNEPFLITAGAELAWFADRVNEGGTALCARVMEPLDLSDMPWTPIGAATGVDTSGGYCGTFDGGGFIIHGLSVTDPAAAERSYTGLFGTVSDGGVIRNVRLAGSIVCDQPDSGGNRILNYAAGGIAGRSTGVIYRCETSVHITDAGTRPAVHVGGIVGQAGGSGIVDGCVSFGTLNGELSNAGGIAGTVRQNAVVRYCRSEGTVAGLRSVGGIAGFLTGGAQLRECENRAAVSGTIGVGGIAGRLDKNSHFSDELDVVVTHAVNHGSISGSSGNACGTGGIAGWVGAVENGGYTGLAALSYLYNSGTVTAGGTTGGTACGGLIGNWKTGRVTHGQSASANRLWGVAETLGTTAEDAARVSVLTPDVTPSGSRWDKTTASRTLIAKRITPTDTRFTIYGAAQSAVYNDILLTYLRRVELSASAEETQTLLTDCETQLKGVLTGAAAAGAQLLADMSDYAAARLYGPEEAAQVEKLLAQAAKDVAAAVTLRGVELLRQTYMGTDRLDGLLQRVPTYPARKGQELYNTFIYQKNYALEDMAALLCAYEDWCLQMQRANAVQAVDALYADARQALSRLAASFRQTDVPPDMDRAAAMALELARTRARQTLSALADSCIAALSALAGELTQYPAARRQQITAALAYSAAAIREAANRDFSALPAYGAVAEALEEASAAVETAYGEALPRIRRLLDSTGDWDGVSVQRPDGSGTADAPYRIGTAQELAWLAQTVNGGTARGLCAVLTANIDLSYQPWCGIGTSAPFTGTLDGQGYTVSGLYIGALSGRAALGLFGAAENAVLRDLTVSGTIDLTGADMADIPEMLSVGGLLGRADGGTTVEGCTAQVDITASLPNADASRSAALGGLAGRLAGDGEHHLTDCRSEGSLTVTLAAGSRHPGGGGQGGAGGIAGSITSAAALTRCVNTGTVTVGRAAGVGGIAGRLDGGDAVITVTQCANQGQISNDTAASLLRRGGTGGIAGLAVSGSVTINSCYNTGVIAGHTIVGGILGGESGDYAASIPSYAGNSALVMQNCYNAGVLRTGASTQRIGSLAGYPLDGCYRDGLTVLTGCARTPLGWRSSQGDSVAQRDTLPPEVFPGLVRSIGGLNGGYPLFGWQLLESRSRETAIAYLETYYTRYVEPYASAAQRQTLRQMLADTAGVIRGAEGTDGILSAYDDAMAALTSPELLQQAVAAAEEKLTALYKAARRAYPHIAKELNTLYKKQCAALADCTTAVETDTVPDGFAAGVVDCLLLDMDGITMKELEEQLPAAERAAAALTDTQRGLLVYYGKLPAAQALLTIYRQNIEKLEKWTREDKRAYADVMVRLTDLFGETRQALDDARDAEKMTAALDTYCAGVAEVLITAIGPVPELLTLDEGMLYQQNVQRAQEAYDQLTRVQKKLVSLTEALLAAQERCRRFEQDLAAARQVETLIAAIGTVTPDSLAALQRAQNAYDALPAAQRLLVLPGMLASLHTAWSNYQVLTAQPTPPEQPVPVAPVAPSPALEPAARAFDWSLVWMSLGVAVCGVVIAFIGAWFAGARRTVRKRSDNSKEWYS